MHLRQRSPADNLHSTVTKDELRSAIRQAVEVQRQRASRVVVLLPPSCAAHALPRLKRYGSSPSQQDNKSQRASHGQPRWPRGSQGGQRGRVRVGRAERGSCRRRPLLATDWIKYQSWFCSLRSFFKQMVYATFDRTKGHLNLPRRPHRRIPPTLAPRLDSRIMRLRLPRNATQA